MDSVDTSKASFEDELLDRLTSGVEPQRVEALRRAGRLVGVSGLVRSLFAADPAELVVRLAVVLELSRVGGRFDRDRVRSLVPFVARDALESAFDALYRGGWLELRALDNSYRVVPLGAYLVSVLMAADFASQSPTNLLVRSAEALLFGDRVDDSGEGTAQLLGLLLAELETQADTAADVIRQGRPSQLIRFSRTEVRQQITQVQDVIHAIEKRHGAATRQFATVVRLHEAIQRILRAHESLARRLSEWNLKQLETSDAGYSLVALTDAALGASDAELLAAPVDALIRCPTVSTERLLSRHQTSRTSVRAARERFVYEAPPEPEATPLSLEDVDPVARAAKSLAEALARTGRLTVAEWLAAESSDFADAAFLIGLIARLDRGGRVALEHGRVARLHGPVLGAESTPGPPSAAIQALVEGGGLDEVAGRGFHSALILTDEHASGEPDGR